MAPNANGPLPGVSYGATMQTADIYPAVLGIGGVRTQDYTIPVFAGAVVQAHDDALGSAHTLGGGLFNTPAGWLTVLLVGLAGLVLYHGAR